MDFETHRSGRFTGATAYADFIEAHVRAQTWRSMTSRNHEGDRWKVLPIVEETKAKAKEAGHLGTCSCRRATTATTMSMIPSNLKGRVSPTLNMHSARKKMGPRRLGE